jgi:hypothetical protein
MQHRTHKSFSQKLFSGSWWALFTMFVWELVEEGLETLIAFCVSEVVALFVVKALSTLAIIGATQGIKVCIKRFLVPLIKTLTYKEGFDKMSKIKKFFTWIWCNKKTLVGTVSTAVVGLSATDVIPASQLPELLVCGFNITPIVYYACLAILSLLGVFGVGIESVPSFFARKDLIKNEKEAKAILKEAKKELANAEKLANQTQAEQEKAKAKAEAEQKAKAEKAKADAEHRAKVEQAKARLVAEQANKK